MTVSRENEGAKTGAARSETSRAPDRESAPSTAPEDHARHGLASGLDGLRQLMDRLLADDGCPWDRAQTLHSLRPYLTEEAHEVLEAIDAGDAQSHRHELGDLLFQIVFQAALREREGAFDLDDVIEAIRSKMIRRHPHVFAPAQASTPTASPRDADDVAARWSELKAAERGESGPRDPLRGVPASLAALHRAWRLQEKAAGVGFDWPDVAGALGKAREEWGELQEAITHGDVRAIEEELGDLLFVLVRVGQKLGVEAEAALRGTNRKFEARFRHMMARCHEDGLEPADAGLARLDGYWNEAKRLAASGREHEP